MAVVDDEQGAMTLHVEARGDGVRGCRGATRKTGQVLVVTMEGGPIAQPTRDYVHQQQRYNHADGEHGSGRGAEVGEPAQVQPTVMVRSLP